MSTATNRKNRTEMKTSEAFPSKYLKADDLQGRDVAVTISDVKLEEFDGTNGKETKMLLYFKGKEKKFVCNKTNAKTLSKLFGSDETDDWLGKSITIGPREVEGPNGMTWGIRVSLKAPAQSAAPARPAPAAPDQADDAPF